MESNVHEGNARDCKMVAKIHLLGTYCRIKRKIDSYHKQELRQYSCHVCFEVICIILYQYSLDIYYIAPFFVFDCVTNAKIISQFAPSSASILKCRSQSNDF